MNTKTIIIFIVVTLGILMGVGGLLWQFGEQANKPIEDVAGSMRHYKGEGEIVVVEFSDFQCPACLSIQAPLKEMLSQYDGEVKLVYRHFPLVSIHPNATIAAWASEAADLQGKFFEMHDILFERQSEWAKETDPTSMFEKYALELELDGEKFMSDLKSQEVKDRVSEDILASSRYRLSGTPSFFVNGIKVDFNQLQAKIQELRSSK